MKRSKKERREIEEPQRSISMKPKPSRASSSWKETTESGNDVEEETANDESSEGECSLPESKPKAFAKSKQKKWNEYLLKGTPIRVRMDLAAGKSVHVAYKKAKSRKRAALHPTAICADRQRCAQLMRERHEIYEASNHVLKKGEGRKWSDQKPKRSMERTYIFEVKMRDKKSKEKRIRMISRIAKMHRELHRFREHSDAKYEDERAHRHLMGESTVEWTEQDEDENQEVEVSDDEKSSVQEEDDSWVIREDVVPSEHEEEEPEAHDGDDVVQAIHHVNAQDAWYDERYKKVDMIIDIGASMSALPLNMTRRFD